MRHQKTKTIATDRRINAKEQPVVEQPKAVIKPEQPKKQVSFVSRIKKSKKGK